MASFVGGLCQLRKRSGSASIRLASFPLPPSLPLPRPWALAAAHAAEASTCALGACPVRTATSSAKPNGQGSVGYICARNVSILDYSRGFRSRITYIPEMICFCTRSHGQEIKGSLYAAT